MFPAIPAPENAGIVRPVELKLKANWRYDSRRRGFVSKSGKIFKPLQALPRKTRIVHKVPSLALVPQSELSGPERDLQRYVQAILPPGESAEKYINAMRQWPCVADAETGPEVSLP